MARIDYDHATAEAFHRAREVPRVGLDGWRHAVERHVQPRPGIRILDVGAGTGMFATAFRDWFDASVTAVEPSAAMRTHIPPDPGIDILAGSAEHLPVPDAYADAAWLSLSVHHIDDLPAAARELRRTLRAAAPVLIRTVFPGRVDGLTNVRFFPGVRRVLDTYPTVDTLRAVFGSAGFHHTALEQVPQQSSPTLTSRLNTIDRHSDTALRALTDEEFEAGMDRLRQAASETPDEPVVDHMDLLVLR